jgi:hypothetical protein
MLWLAPGGFPVWHARFWINGVFPLALLGLVGSAVAASRGRRDDWLRALLAAFPAGWGAAAVMARVVFPVTFERLFWPPLYVAVLMGAAVYLTFRRHGAMPGRPIVAVAVPAALAGAMVPLSQCAPAPDTHPLGYSMPVPVVPAQPPSVADVLQEWPGGRLRVHPGDGSVSIKAGRLTVRAEPLLKFISRSPDGCWGILAPPRQRDGPDLVLRSALILGGRLVLQYRADYDATLRIAPDHGTGPIRLEALALLPRPIFSHLNAFCDLHITGHKRLALSFSPFPEMQFDVDPADYPVGRPLRLAYRDSLDNFRVVEASSGEKGPFRLLASGPLSRSNPLGITLHDQGTAVAQIVLYDWADEVSTALSPTAGWNLPVNAIEFSLEGDRANAPADLFITLAGTSVGRGWDSVGHRAGTYRNRMRIDVLEASAPTPGN